MSIKKTYLENGKKCRVTFNLKDYPNAETVQILGDFNNWDRNSEPLKKNKAGVFSKSLKFETGREYQFRYLIDHTVWENELEADKYVPNGFSSSDYNSVIVL